MRRENVMVWGLTPFSPGDLRGCLELLVKELQELWMGVKIGAHDVRAALICVANDTPAARKVSAFLGVGASAGCHRCEKYFLRIDGTSAASYTDFSPSPKRTAESVARHAAAYKAFATKDQAEGHAQLTGVRYTPLLALPYFQPALMTIVDAMHSLFLGVAKNLIATWRSMPLRSKPLSHNHNEFADSAPQPFRFIRPPFPSVPCPRVDGLPGTTRPCCSACF